MSLMNIVQSDATLAGETNTLGGGRRLPESGMYPSRIDMAYLSESSGGAFAMNLHLTLLDAEKGNTEHRETIYFTNKQKQTFYTKDGEKHALPGFMIVDALSLLVTGKSVLELDTQDATLKLWSGAAKAEVPTQVKIFPDLVGQEIYTGIVKALVNKQEKGGDGKYHAIAETREEATIDKFFRAADKLTTPEIRAGETEAKFYQQWVERFAGKVVDRTKKDLPARAPGAVSPMQGATAAAPAVAKPTTSMFG